MALIKPDKIYRYDIDTPGNIRTDNRENPLWTKVFNLSPDGQAITDTATRIGTVTVDARGAKYAVLDLAVTANDSTDLHVQIVYGRDNSGSYDSEFTNKEVGTDATTRSEAVPLMISYQFFSS